jgi:hypothetical protein
MEVLMGLSRKRQRELNRLKKQAEAVLHDQREILEHASRVVREATHQASNFAREEVSPRVKDAYEDRVRPAVRSGVAAAKHGREKFVDDVLPAVTAALGSAIAVIESVKGPAKDTLGKVSKSARQAGVKTGLVEPPRSGPAKYIVLGVVALAVAGVAYAAWQTLRADDSLWIEDEPETDEPETDEPEL